MSITKFKEKVEELQEKYNELIGLMPENILECINNPELKDKLDEFPVVKKFISDYKNTIFKSTVLSKIRPRLFETLDKEGVTSEIYTVKNGILNSQEGVDNLINQVKTTDILEKIKELCHSSSTESH